MANKKAYKYMNGFNRLKLDIGAYEGEWASDFNEVFPGSKIFMFEAQEEKRPY